MMQMKDQLGPMEPAAAVGLHPSVQVAQRQTDLAGVVDMWVWVGIILVVGCCVLTLPCIRLLLQLCLGRLGACEGNGDACYFTPCWGAAPSCRVP
jgi:hypothetical protein